MHKTQESSRKPLTSQNVGKLAKLMKLDVTKLTHTVGLAGVCNVALRQTRSGELSMWKGCAFANAARNGVFAATLAADGMTGPAPIFEGDLGFFKLVARDAFTATLGHGPAAIAARRMSATKRNNSTRGYDEQRKKTNPGPCPGLADHGCPDGAAGAKCQFEIRG